MSAFAPVKHAIQGDRQRPGDAEERAAWSVQVARGALDAGGVVRPDGYRPICDALWASAATIGRPPRPETRSLLSLARHLDAANVQLSRVRAGIEALPPPGDAAGRAATHELIGEAELAIDALAVSLDLATKLARREPHLAALPNIITRERRRVKRLRDHYGRVDSRALEFIHDNPALDVEAAFRLDPLIARRTYSDGKRSLRLDGEITELFAATRSYVAQAWLALVDRETP